MKATLTWQGTRDLDLAAYWRHGEERGLVYYGDVGDRTRAPWIELTADDDGRVGENVEELLISRPVGTIWLLCWDAAWVDSAEGGPLEADFSLDEHQLSIEGMGNLAVLGVVRDGVFTARPQIHTITGLQHIDRLEALLG